MEKHITLMALGKTEHAALPTINWLKWTHLVCSKSVYTWHEETAMKKTNPIKKSDLFSSLPQFQ